MAATVSISPQTPIRIFIVDDHALFRDALRQLLEDEPGFAVVGEAASAKEAFEQLPKLQPDLMLLDLNMPTQSGMEVLRTLGPKNAPMRTILLAASIRRPQIIEALCLGASGVLMKDSASHLLYKSIKSVMSGQYWVDHGSVSDLVGILRDQRPRAPGEEQPTKHGLTPRELEIISTIVDGYTNKDIAEKFHISEQTVKHHLTNIFSKVGVGNRLELALFAINKRLIPTS